MQYTTGICVVLLSSENIFLPVTYGKVELKISKNVISFLNVYGCAVEFIILGENTS